MRLETMIFLSGVGMMLILVASLVFTVYEVRRTNPHAFGPKSQIKPPDR